MSDDNDTPLVTYRLDGNVAVITIDDGKANAISHVLADQLDLELSHALADDAAAIVILGRPGRFSAGFDLTIMQSGIEEARDLLRVGAELALRIYTFPIPVVLGVTGHALAMGAILLMAADVRVGTRGSFKIGLNEVAIGMPVPKFATELADDRLSRRHLNAAVNLARVYDPEGAVDAGYLDLVVDAEGLVQLTINQAHELADTLKPVGFGRTRTHLRGERAARIEAGLAADIGAFAIEG
jgi:enoyl-CoA hydratase